MAKILKEGFDYQDLVKQIDPTISVDEYSAKMGADDEIVTLAFTVRGQQASTDLVDWFERGYDWVLDSQVSEGEVSKGKYLVFVEMKRRSTVPERIVEMIEDLETLSGLSIDEWKVIVDESEHSADVESLKSVIILSPHAYRETEESADVEQEVEMNEVRHRAGIQPHKIFKEQDSLIKDFIAKAGL